MSREKWYEKEISEMVSAVSETNTIEDVRELFDKILTPREINDIGRRLKAVKMLAAGEPYSEIREKLDLSPVIISRLSNKIGYGFRRTSKTANKRVKEKIKNPKRTIRYKGAPTF